MTLTPLSSTSERIRRIVALIGEGKEFSPQERAEALDILGQYECWGPYFRLLHKSMLNPGQRQLEDYVKLARVQNLYLENVFAAAETCIALIADLNVSFATFCEVGLPAVIEEDDHNAEATILGAACEYFAELPDRIMCLERLCMLYEKKTHNEALLTQTYEKLLAVDPHNVKALRYFKLMFTQENEWEEVVAILKTLTECVTHPQELFRVAQELAAIHLYQLDMPEDAIRVLERYCVESPLNTSNILYDAYQRLADWQGCLRVLRESLLSVDDDNAAAILHFKMAKLHEHLDEPEKAMEDFVKAANLWPKFLDPIEGIINLSIVKNDWQKVKFWLARLSDSVSDEKLKAQLQQAAKRLEDGLGHAQRG